VAAKIGVTYGWSHIYDLGLEQRVMAAVTPYANGINTMHNYVTPPPLAWLHVPFTLLSVPAGFVVWVIFTTALLIGAWWLVAPGRGLGRVTLLLIAFALWPMYYAFLIGQTVPLTIACLAACWWFLDRQRWAPAGITLALALFVKPQLVLLLPLALLVSGRWRPVLYCALGSLVLGAVSLASLGPHGIATYETSVSYTSTNVFHGILTFAWFGRGMVATSIEVSLGLIALALAWYRRDRVDLVFALGIVGSTASAFYLHEYDVPIFVLPAWVLLRSRLSVPQRAWLLLGIACEQLVAIGVIRPILLWEAGWIGLLGLEPWLVVRVPKLTMPSWVEASPVRS
jgi:glycosyl transferase family 87